MKNETSKKPEHRVTDAKFHEEQRTVFLEAYYLKFKKLIESLKIKNTNNTKTEENENI